jgi:hypothetical protein
MGVISKMIREGDGIPPTGLTTLTAPGGVLGRLVESTERKLPAPAPPQLQAEPRKDPPSREELLAMSYEEFAKADLVLLVRSAVLDDDIVLASSSEVARRAPREMVVYILDELRKFYVDGTLDVDALKAFHRSKRGFGDARVICGSAD